jgi:TonB family protein
MVRVTHWLIGHAARRAPEELSSRLEEEWLADLQSRTSTPSRLRFALGCCWAALVIVGEYGRSAAPAMSPAATARGFVTLGDRNFRYVSLRSGTLFLIAGLHAALFYALITSASHTRAPVIPSNLQNQEVRPAKPDRLPVLPPDLDMKRTTIDVSKFVLDPPPIVDVNNDATTLVVEKPHELNPNPPTAETSTHVVHEITGGPGAGFPQTADYYPSFSIHMGEEGLSTVRVCVDPKGRLTAEPTTVNSSGSARLDEGALRLARAGSGHYRATTRDGQRVDSCYSLGIRFQLKQ